MSYLFGLLAGLEGGVESTLVLGGIVGFTARVGLAKGAESDRSTGLWLGSDIWVPVRRFNWISDVTNKNNILDREY